jgi:hypothetical protein
VSVGQLVVQDLCFFLRFVLQSLFFGLVRAGAVCFELSSVKAVSLLPAVFSFRVPLCLDFRSARGWFSRSSNLGRSFSQRVFVCPTSIRARFCLVAGAPARPLFFQSNSWLCVFRFCGQLGSVLQSPPTGIDLLAELDCSPAGESRAVIGSPLKLLLRQAHGPCSFFIWFCCCQSAPGACTRSRFLLLVSKLCCRSVVQDSCAGAKLAARFRPLAIGFSTSCAFPLRVAFRRNFFSGCSLVRPDLHSGVPPSSKLPFGSSFSEQEFARSVLLCRSAAHRQEFSVFSLPFSSAARSRSGPPVHHQEFFFCAPGATRPDFPWRCVFHCLDLICFAAAGEAPH